MQSTGRQTKLRFFPASAHYLYVHHPYDRMTKQAAARAARSLLDLAGVLPPDCPVALRSLEREVAGPALRTDQLFAYEQDGDWVVHFEFERRWTAIMPSRVLRYQKVITLEYPGVEVNSLVFVLRRGSCPDSGIYSHREGRFSPVTEARYRVVRIWELDAARVMAEPASLLLPLAALMNSTDEQVRQIGGRVAEDREAAGEFLALLAIRYDREQIEKLLGENPMFTKAILKESWAVQEVMEDSRIEGRAEGEAKGRTEGRTEEARKLLIRSLASRFPGLESLPELDVIQDATILEDLLLEQVIGGSDRETTLNAIRRAAGK